jgi:hypothetical protein
MPDYTVTRVTYEEGDEFWHVKSVIDGYHPGQCKLPVKDFDAFWPAGRTYSDRKKDSFFKAQRANMCDQLAGVLIDILDSFKKRGVTVTLQGEPVLKTAYHSANLHENGASTDETGKRRFQNPVLVCPDEHASLLLLGVREEEGAVGHSWVQLEQVSTRITQQVYVQ